MPELPEIEIIRRILKSQLVGKMIASVEVNNAQVIAYPDEQSFVVKLTGLTFADIDRRGKYLILIMESGDRMVVHLRMTGLTPSGVQTSLTSGRRTASST